MFFKLLSDQDIMKVFNGKFLYAINGFRENEVLLQTR